MTAYVHHIRRARHFLYIETQYFFGSAYAWRGATAAERRSGCSHVIPAEIAAKLRHKIRSRERFTAYIVVPLHPQGPPVRT